MEKPKQPSQVPSIKPEEQHKDNTDAVTNNKKTNTLAIVGLILAILLPLIGLIISIIALSQIKKSKEGGKGLAIAGIVVGSILFFFQLIFFGSLVSSSSKLTTTEPTQSSKPAPTQTTQTESKPAEPTVPKYDLVGERGSYKVFVTDPSNATESQLTLIGKDLNKKYGNEQIVLLSVFTDKNQAQILASDPLKAADLEGAAAKAYENAYVLQFNINKNTGNKKLIIFPFGENKEIKL